MVVINSRLGDTYTANSHAADLLSGSNPAQLTAIKADTARESYFIGGFQKCPALAASRCSGWD